MKKTIWAIMFILLLGSGLAVQYVWDNQDYSNLFNIWNVSNITGNQSNFTTRCFGSDCVDSWSEVGNNSSREFNSIVGSTTSTYDGNMSNSTHIGYVRANLLCAGDIPGSHFCLKSEVLKAISNNNASLTGTYWFQNGPPGFTANADDCAGWDDNDNTFLGPFWNFGANGGVGAGRLTNCAQSKKLLCCGG